MRGREGGEGGEGDTSVNNDNMIMIIWYVSVNAGVLRRLAECQQSGPLATNTHLKTSVQAAMIESKF